MLFYTNWVCFLAYLIISVNMQLFKCLCVCACVCVLVYFSVFVGSENREPQIYIKMRGDFKVIILFYVQRF